MPFRKAMLTLAALSLVLVSVLPAHAQGATTTKSTTTTKTSSVGMAKSSMKSTATAATTKMVDINTASKEELEALPGIGDAIADKIIAGRPFANKHQLVTKKLVNAAQYKAMSPHIVASGGMATPASATKKSTTTTTKKTSTKM
jgi:DNA uptake protein ComE-like DNA-binding protein